MIRPARHACTALLCAAALAHALHALFGLGGPGAERLFTFWVYLGVLLGAALLALWRVVARLAGEEIPLGARIIAVCDAFDAMTSARSYREPLPADRAVAELRRCAGTQFDPAVVECFVAALEADEAAAHPQRVGTGAG